ncbi:MAG: hypothetical protein OXI78_07720 [Anaerolineaceae bacterium]|nr:hypothetical protein [Anaerolineaceae bacterium]
MAVLLWSERDGVRATEVRTGRPVRLSAEEYRSEAESLDPQLDALLDDALSRLKEYAGDREPRPLLKAWVLGRAVRQSGVLEGTALRDEVRELLWQALAHKCWYGLRADGSHERRWRLLRSASERRVNPSQAATNTFRYEDFEIGHWLQQQEFDDATALFNGMMRNAQELFRHPAQRHVNVRNAILHWLRQQPSHMQRRLLNTHEFRAIPKALTKLFPSSGPGSARLPQHIEESVLRQMVVETLDARFCGDQP